MTDEDKSNIKDLSLEFEVDFISLSFTRSGEDIQSAREFLDSINMTTTKVLLHFLCMCTFLLVEEHDNPLPYYHGPGLQRSGSFKLQGVSEDVKT